jgi:hypothetical protein
MPVSFDRCSYAVYRNHPETAALILSEVRSTFLVPLDLDPTNGELGKAARAEAGPIVYVLTDKKIYNGSNPILYSLKVFFNGQTYRLILADEKGWVGKKAIEIQTVVGKQFNKGDAKKDSKKGMLATQRWNASFQQMANTIATQTGTDGSNSDMTWMYGDVNKT